MLNKFWRTGMIIGLALTLTACAVNNDDAGDNNGIEMKARDNVNPMHNNTRMEMDERIADSVADMKEVDAATVLLTDRNAYVAVRTEDDTPDVKGRISSKVKQMAPKVRNVYVSANPDFVNRMRGYADRFQSGQPISGMMIEFNQMVERVFPDNAANDGNGNGNMRNGGNGLGGTFDRMD